MPSTLSTYFAPAHKINHNSLRKIAFQCVQVNIRLAPAQEYSSNGLLQNQLFVFFVENVFIQFHQNKIYEWLHINILGQVF